jgi:iron(III) transport system permease protein
MNSKNYNFLNKILVVLMLIAIILPLLFLLYLSIGSESTSEIMINSRRILLLAKSIALGLNVSLVSFIISFFFSIIVINHKKKNLYFLTCMILTFYLIAPYIHALSWLRILDVGSYGYLKTLIVLSMYYIPLNTIVILMGLNSIDKDYINMAKVYKNDNVILYKIILGMLKPYALSVISLVFIFVISDFSVPSLFQFKTYSFEIFTIYTSGSSYKELVLLSMPLVLVNTIAFIILFINSGKMSYFNSGSSILKNISLKLNRFNKTNTLLSIFILLILSLVIFSNITQILDIKVLFNTLLENIDELSYSIKISLLSSLIAIILVLFIVNTYDNTLIKFIILSPLLFPGALLGISIIGFFINFKYYGYLLNSDVLMVYSNTVKSIPIIYFVLKGSLDTQNKNLLDCGKLYQKNTVHRLIHIDIPYFIVPIAIALYVGFSNVFGEISSSILLLPPGKQLLSLKIYSYLHYGSGSKITALGFIIIVIFTTITFAILSLINRKRRFLR